MIKKLTFKEYLESKEKLKKSVERIPEQTIIYTISKYIRLPVGESKDDKTLISLKPRDRIHIHLIHEQLNSPIVKSIMFEGVTGIDDTQKYNIYWSAQKLLYWLTRNGNINH